MKRAITTYDVFVGTFDGDLANDVVERKVSKMFIKFGETKGLFVKENNQGKFVVVKYLCDQDAEKAVADCNGALLDGVPVKCYRMEKRNKPGGPGGGAGLGSKDSQQKKVFQKNPDIVPSVEPRASSSPGPEGEPILTQTSPLPWNPRSQLSVMITHIETPTLVWAQLVSDATIEEQMTITQKLAEKCPVAPKVQGRTDPTKIYGAQFSEDGLWYRCQVRMAFNPDRVKVQYIDFGNSEEVNPKDLVELPEELTMPKPFAMKIMFHNVRYIHSKEKEATAFLKEVTEGNYVTVTPTFRLPDGSGQFAHLSIGGLNLNQELVERGFATQKQPKQPSQGPGDGFGRPSSMGGDSSGYGPGLGIGGSGVMGGGGDATFRQVPSLGMQAAGRGGQPGKAPLLGEAPSKGPQPVYSDLKIELKNKSRALEKASKEKEIAGAELNNLRGKMKNLQTEFTVLTNRLQENNISLQIQAAASMVEKVRKLRGQFSEESTPIDEAIQLATSAEKLREDSITTLPPVMTALGNYRTQQQRICQFKDQPVPEDEIQARDQLRKELFECLTDCIKEMEQKPFTSRAQSITQCIEKLHSHYDNFFNMPVQQFPDLQSVVEQYEEFKTSRMQDFEQTRLLTDQQQQAVLSQLEQLAKQLSLSSSIQREGVDMDLGNQLRQYCVCLQQEMACKNVEGSGDAVFIASLVKTVHHDLKSEVLCANNFIRLQADFCEMRKNMEGWLDKKPSADKLIANRSTLKALKSKLRHRLADKHDAEENNDDEELNEIKKDIVAIQQEIHAALQVEDEELSELAMMIDSHFPELLNLHPDCGLDIHLAYNGLVKPSHAVDHYDLKPVPGSTGRLFYSTFAGKPVIVIECLLSDSHHLGRDEFLGQLTNYTNITHPALLRPSAVFFDKNNRHAYLQIEKEGDILANYVEYENLPKQDSSKIIRSVTEGLKVLHENKVLHGEINPHSIIRHPDGTAALLPPDLSCRPADRAKCKYTSPNNLEFMAPEMLNMTAGMEPTGTVDMYCVGILLLWLACPTDPINYNPDGSLDVNQFQLDPMATNLVKSLSSHIPHMRPSAEMLLQTQFVLQSTDSREGSAVVSPIRARPFPHLGLFSTRTPMSEMSFMPNLQMPPPPLPAYQQPPPPIHHQLPQPLPAVAAQLVNTPGPVPPAPNNFADMQQDSAFNGYPSSDLHVPPNSEPNGLNARDDPSPPLSSFVSAADSMTSVPAMPVAQDCAPSGFEEAALEQEQLEQESREAVEQFSDADQGYAGLAGVGDSTGSFEIGTFSVDDVGGASAGGGDGLRGRKITRQLSGEGDGNGEEWADAASEEKPGGTVDDEIGDWSG